MPFATKTQRHKKGANFGEISCFGALVAFFYFSI